MKKKSTKRLKALSVVLVLALAGLIGLKAKRSNTPEDIKPTIYTCGTPLGAFQVSNEIVKISLSSGNYTFENDEQVVVVSAVNCVSQRKK